MENKEQLEKQQRERRDFLSCLGSAIACGAATMAANAASPAAAAPMAERIERALSWNRFAGDIAAAGARARERRQ